jgi:hypothetical protein
MRIVALILFVGVVCCGCWPPPPYQPPGPGPAADEMNALEIVRFEPGLPATLHPGDKLHVIIHYRMHSVDTVRIFARPYTNGQPTPGYGAHGSPEYGRGEGEVDGWFSFTKPTKVHEVRVRMVDAGNQDHVLAEISRPIKAVWVKP